MTKIKLIKLLGKKSILIVLLLSSMKLYTPMELPITSRNILPEVFLGKGVLKECSKVTGEQPCRSLVLTKLLL